MKQLHIITLLITINIVVFSQTNEIFDPSMLVQTGCCSYTLEVISNQIKRLEMINSNIAIQNQTNTCVDAEANFWEEHARSNTSISNPSFEMISFNQTNDTVVPENKPRVMWQLPLDHPFNQMLFTRRNDKYSGNCYYTSTNQTDYTILFTQNDSSQITNLLAKLNRVYEKQKWENEIPTVTGGNHVDRRQIKIIQLELFELGAIPILANNIWVNGTVLTTNNFSISHKVHNSLFMLNWYEQNENPLHVQMYGTNAVVNAASKNLDKTFDTVYQYGYRVWFDRRFNLWRIVEEFENYDPEYPANIKK